MSNDQHVQWLIQQIKERRVQVDACIQQMNIVNFCSDEIEEAEKKLIEAKMWLGVALGKLGHKLPEEYRDEAK